MLNKLDAVMDWKNKYRVNLIERVNVPCRHSEWRPAIEVYAGKDWTEDVFLEEAYASRSDRSFLCSPPDDKESRKNFELLARWLGVGWSPKVLPIVNYEDRQGTKEGVLWQRNVFPVQSMPSKWREHCAELNTASRIGLKKYNARLRQDWTIDGDETVLSLPRVFANVVREWRCYKGFLSSVIYHSSNRQKDNDNDKLRPPPDSYLAYLFKHIEWIPVEEGVGMAAARDIFAKGDQVYDELKGWVFGPSIDIDAAVAKEIGIRSGWKDVRKPDWLRWLQKSLEAKPEEIRDQREQITALYQQAIRHFGYDERDQWSWDKAIWCIEKRTDNTAVWLLEDDRRKIFYVDRPDLSRLRWDKLRIFPLELGWSGNRGKVLKIFDVKPLSEHLHGTAKFTGQKRNDLAEKIHERFKSRMHCLAAFLKVKGNEPSAIQEKWEELDFLVGHDLQLMFTTESILKYSRLRHSSKQKLIENARTLADAWGNFTDQGKPQTLCGKRLVRLLLHSWIGCRKWNCLLCIVGLW